MLLDRSVRPDVLNRQKQVTLFSMLVVQFECDAFFGSKCLILSLIWNVSDSANVSCNARQDLLRKKAP